MSYFPEICFNFLILGFISQLIIIQRVNALEISVDKQTIELNIVDYLEHLDILEKTTKGPMKKFWSGSSMKKEATEICNLKPPQLLTLCQWIATSEPYKNSKFLLADTTRFLPRCDPQDFQLSDENNRQCQLKMVTCPYMKKNILKTRMNELPFSAQPGVLSVSGCVGVNSVLVFITHLRDHKIIFEPYGYVTGIDMVALKKVKKFKKVVKKATDVSVEIDNLSTRTEDSEEFAEGGLRFKDLL